MALSVTVLELGVLAGCAAGRGMPVERVEKVDADGVEGVAPEESAGAPSEMTTPSAARSEQANASPEEVRVIREQGRVQGDRVLALPKRPAPTLLPWDSR